MKPAETSGTFRLGDRSVTRMGYGAMQLSGPRAFGPPKDPASAKAVLRAALDAGITHIDTSDFYGPHQTNCLIREALHPYPDDLTLVTKIGARRDAAGGWLRADSPKELRQAVHDNLTNLGLEALDVVNLRVMASAMSTAEGSVAEQVLALADLQREGLVRHIGISNATPAQVAEARSMVDIVCVQNLYNIASRAEDALVDALARDGIAFVPYFPLGGFAPLQSTRLSEIAARVGASSRQVALAWLLRRSPNILLIPGTSSVTHLHDIIAAAGVALDDVAMRDLDGIAVAA
ncbi:oxidoreductase [Primorskyibacter flagellatus]|uniref:Oxidoreductase n=1 Tax=Primorskyibacter flagellatus TaxID=1387277 RepID=A0A917A7X2_9RHOB|nr:oxidoreductase [Primorskyibacter flagellatus]GGE34175.1 oxidoreductase [Primorskyibacter flagellatus]